MKARKSRRGVSTIIAVLLMIIITVAAAVIVWAFLSGYIGARTAPTTQTSVIQINAIGKGPPATIDQYNWLLWVLIQPSSRST
jgi:FlaG/FlaF family flagellin (archaellin)